MFVFINCGNSVLVNNGVEIPSQDEYLSSNRDCDFFFGANFLMARDGTTIHLTVPATQATTQGELEPDNTFQITVQDNDGNDVSCTGEFTLGDDMDFECITSTDTICTASYSRNAES